MGQRLSKSNAQNKNESEIIEKAIGDIFGDTVEPLTVDKVIEPILIICRNISEQGSFKKTQEGLRANQAILKIVYHKNYDKTLQNLLFIVAKQCKSIMDSKLIALISRQRFRKCLNISNFCLFFSDETLIQTINLMIIRTDIHTQTRALIKQLSEIGAEIQSKVFDNFTSEKKEQICKLIRISLNYMIELHLKIISRSDLTLKIVDLLHQSMFMLYSKLYFNQKHKDVKRREKTQNFKMLLNIGGYFLGLGLNQKIPSIYETAIILIANLFENNVSNIKQVKAFPSHLFKKLPLINTNSLLIWIVCNLLYALKYAKQGLISYSRLNFNRISSLKLLEFLIRQLKLNHNQITYFIEELCLQTKPGQIERVYVSLISESYVRNGNVESDIISKYALAKDVEFKVKYSNKSVRVRPIDIRTELEDNEDSNQTELKILIAKFIYQMIFQKNEVSYEYSDKALWNQILYGIQQKQQMEQPGEDIKQQKMQMKEDD